MANPGIAPQVATPETWTPSRRMRAAAASERERVNRELTRLSIREAQLRAELEAVEGHRADLEHQRDVLAEFADESARTPGKAARRLRAVPDDGLVPPPVGATTLRGARIRETAVRVLAAHSELGAPVHYRDWFNLLTAQGFLPTGKDPLATFLTQISRSPVVRRSTSAGMYVLNAEAPRRLRARLTQLSEELASTQALAPGVSVDEIAAARERRTQLTSEIHETERQLEEALRSLGGDES
jgi:hypothetical protein